MSKVKRGNSSARSKMKTIDSNPENLPGTNFQDGGQQNSNCNNVESSSDSQNYTGRNMHSENYNKLNDNMTGQNNSGNATLQSYKDRQEFPPFGQYGPGLQTMRGNYPQSNNAIGMNRSMSGNMAMPPYNQNRMGMQQQSGPTPTLNQLLTNVNAGQRYSSNAYGQGDYSKSNDVNNANGSNYNQMWSAQQRAPGMGSYNSTGQYANQNMYDSQGRPVPMGNTGYPPTGGPVNNAGGAPYNDYSMPRGGYPGGQHRPGMPSLQNYNQQHMAPYGNGPQQPQPPTSQSGNTAETPPQESSRPSSNATIIDENSNSETDISAASPSHSLAASSSTSTTSSAAHGGSSTTLNSSVSSTTPHPPPSPSGSTGSRSNTPASQSGNPPGNVHNHVDGSNRIQSPMATQGFNMMPPPGSNGSGYPGPGKMGPGPGMHPSHMPYNQQNGPYGNQGNMGRPGGGPLQWNQQQNAYGMSGHHQNGPNMGQGPSAMPMNRQPMSNNYPNYNHNSNHHSMGMNNHMGGMNTGPDSLPPNQSLPPNVGHNSTMSNMPANPPSTGSNTGANTTKGAQAAAQAAVDAAAKFAGGPKDPMNKQQTSMSGTQGGLPQGQRPNMPPYNQYPNPGGPMNHYGGNMMNPAGPMNNQSPPPMNMGGSNWTNNHMGGPGGPGSMPGNGPNSSTHSGTPSTQPTERSTPTPTAVNNSGDGDSCPPAVSSDQSLQAQLHNDSSQSSQISQQSSQDSVTSAPSQSNTPNADDSMLPREVRITKHENLSHPPTPASIVPSPSASLSSVHDDFDSISSPGWPGTPSQKVGNGNEGVNKMFDMGDEPERRPFLERLFAYMEDIGAAITAMPCISKQPIDLFKLFVVVREKGGVIEVTKSKKWREVCTALNLGASGSAGFTLRKNYIKYLLSYECKFIHGGIDPKPFIVQLESMSTKKESRKNASQNNMDTFRQQPNNQGFDGYGGHNQYAPGPMGQNEMGMGHPNMMPNNQGGMMPNNQGGMMPNNQGGMMPNNHGMMPNSQGMMPNNQGGMMSNNQGVMTPNSQGMMPNNQSGMMPNNPGMMGSNQGGMMANNQGGMMPNSNMYDNNMSGNNSMQPNSGGMPPNPGGMPPNPGGMTPNSGGMPPNSGGMPPNSGSMPPNSGGMPPNSGGMPPNSGGMPPNSVPSMGANRPPHSSGMPPNTSVMPGMMNNMMNNSTMSNNSMGNSGMPNPMSNMSGSPMVPNRPMPMNNSDSINVTDPFSDEANRQFNPRQNNSQLPPYNNYMNNYNMNNRPSMASSPSMYNTNSNQSGTPSPALEPSKTPDLKENKDVTAEVKAEVKKEKDDEVTSSVSETSTGGTTISTAITTATSTTSSTTTSSAASSTTSGKSTDNTDTADVTVKTEDAPAAVASITSTSSTAADSGTTSTATSSVPATTSTATSTTSTSCTTTSATCSPAPSPALSQTSEPGHPARFNSPQLTSSPGPRSVNPQDYYQQQQQQHMGGSGSQGNCPPYRPMQQQGAQGMYPGGGGGGGGPQQRPPYQQMPDQYQQQGYNNMMQQQNMYPQKPMGMNPYPNSYNMGNMPQGNQQQWGGPMQQGPMQQGPMQQGPNQQRYNTGSPNSMAPTMNNTMSSSSLSQASHMPPMYSRMNTPQHRISPHRPENKQATTTAQSPNTAPPFHSPAKGHAKSGMPGSPGMPAPPYQMRKDLSFPPDCVEVTHPVMTKKRKIVSKDLSQTDPWRLMMALKSGLLAESTWALDTLTVLLYDDNTVSYFHLQNMPGLVEVLLEHFRHCLIAIFDMFHDLETDTKRCEHSPHSPSTSLHNAGSVHDIVMSGCDKSLVPDCTMPEGTIEEEDDSVLLTPDETTLDNTNFTYHTRQGKPVKIEQHSAVVNTVVDPKHWDKYEGFDSGIDMWMVGQGCVTDHIVTQFESSTTRSTLHKCFYGKHNTKILNELSDDKPPVLEQIKKEPRREIADMDTSSILSPSYGNETAESDVCISKNDDSDKQNATCVNQDSTPVVKPDPDRCLQDDTQEYKPQSNCDVGNNKDLKLEDKTEDKTQSLNTESKTHPKCTDGKKEPECQSNPESIDGEKESKSSDCNSEVIDDGDDSSKPSEEQSQDAKHFSYYPEGDDDISTKEDMLVVDTLKRSYDDMEGEAEAYSRDKHPLDLSTQTEDEISQRCVCLSNILRNLSFLPGNEMELAKHRSLMTILGRLLLLHHEHPKKTAQQKKYDRDTDLDGLLDDAPEEIVDTEWWWDTLEVIRENTLVTLANIAGYLNLQDFPEEVTMPILDGLLHWAVCPSAYAMDSMPSMSARSDLTPQRLVLETMSKLCVNKVNVDLLIATPPYSRALHLIAFLVRLLSDKKDQVLREFAIVLLSSIVEGSTSAARAVALHQPSVALLIDFIEGAELAAQQMNLQPPITSDHSEMLGTTLDMLKRAASALALISEVPVNKSMFLQHQPRLLQLVMSHYLDQSVSSHLADVLYRCSQS